MTGILAVNPGHNGSVAYLLDGKLEFYCEEERFSRLKYDGNPFRGILYVLERWPVDHIVLGGTSPDFVKLPWTLEDPYSALVRKFNPNVVVHNLGDHHHLGHAASAFYNSGFDHAVAIIADGSGTMFSTTHENQTIAGFETETVFKCSYPNNFEVVYKRLAGWPTDNIISFENGNWLYDTRVTITKAYEAVSDYLGFGWIEAGKTMGLAPYGKRDDRIPKLFVDGFSNTDILKGNYPAGATIDTTNTPYLKQQGDPKSWHKNPNLLTDQAKNLAWHVQQETQEMMGDLIQKSVEQTGETNVVLSGGFALNCVANYYYLQRFPDLNFYVDPIAHDGGTTIGLTKLLHYQLNNQSPQLEPLRSVYLGGLPSYTNLNTLINQLTPFNQQLSMQDATPHDVAALITQGNIVALFQGGSEGGPRALGNRSILFDPRDPLGKQKVNQVKGREWFRPFAGSVMIEHAHDWFDLQGLAESPFMMYAVNVWEDKANQIPAVCHVDNTCRVQTVSQDQNPNYWNLINEFYKLTNCPILFNTSFNLAGHPLVETLLDAFLTVVNSDIEYLYLPDVNQLVTKTK